MLNQKTWLRMRFGIGPRIMFYETLRDFVGEGVAVFEVVRRIEASSSTFKAFPDGVLRAIMNSMRGSQQRQDASLGAALRAWAPPMEATLISAGERSGRISVALHEAAQMMRAHQRARSHVISKMAYPALLLAMLAGLLSVLGTFLIPMLEQMQPRQQWTGAAKTMGFLADNSGTISACLLGGTALFAALFLLTLKRWVGPVRDFFDRFLPPWTLYRQMQASMALMTTSMLIASGVPMATALELLKQSGSPWMSEHMSRILMRMRSGQGDGPALAGAGGMGTLFDPYLAWQISLYSANGSMAAKLRTMAEGSNTRVESAISGTFAVAKAVVMLLVALTLVMTYVSYMSVTSVASSAGGAF